jgi:16S rRNA (guanine1516-N2)-methyltransferase
MSISHPRQDSVLQQGGIAVIVDTQEARLIEEAKQLLHLLGDANENPQYILYFGERGVELKTPEHINHNGQRVDFSTIDIRVGAGNLSKKQPLPKAIGDYKTVVDATAGFGMDAVRLALMGYQVVAIEQSPIISAMLRDGLWRVEQIPEMKHAIGKRVRFIESNSVEHLQQMREVEVVYIDPMFPPKRKKSALPPGHIQTLQSIVGHDIPEKTQMLFDTAMQSATRRVVIKRPTHAPTMAHNPVAVHEGKLVRYEVYRPAEDSM